MAIYEVGEKGFRQLDETSFSAQGIKERADLQRMLKESIEIISPDTLVIAEEFGDWEDSKRRIDLLGIDKNANLVVIELKRTEDGGHMDLQAIRYASMVSTLTYQKVLEIYGRFLKENEKEGDPQENILEFLELEELDEEDFAQDVRIVLASAEFSREITSSVLWLNDQGLDISCVRLRPYRDGERTLIDVQRIIPLPEATDYQVQVSQKRQKERQARSSGRDLTKFELTVGGEVFTNLPKRRVMYHIIDTAIRTGTSPEQLANMLSWRRNNLFVEFLGKLNEEEFRAQLMETDAGGQLPRWRRFFCKQDELFYLDGKTWAMSNQWGDRTLEAVDLISKSLPNLQIKILPAST